MKRRPDDDFPPDLIDADEAISLVIDGLLMGNDTLRKQTKTILKAQKKLRRVVDDEGWNAYLRLEAVVNEWTSMQMDVLVPWALGHGPSSPLENGTLPRRGYAAAFV